MLYSAMATVVYDNTRIWPSTRTVVIGDTAYFHCKTTASPLWSQNGNPFFLSNKNEEYLVINDYLVITEVQQSNSGTYTCVGVKEDGSSFMASSTLIVAIVQNDRMHPKENRVYVGMTADFWCDSDGPVDWIFNNGPLFPNARPITKRHVRIKEAKLHHAGIYECRGKFGNDQQDFIAKGKLEVYDQSRIRPRRLLVLMDTDVSFYCLSKRIPQWTYNEGDLPLNVVVHNEAEKSIVKIFKATYANQGYYKCSGQTEDGETFAARVEVKVYEVYHKRLSPSYQKALVGQTVHFVCLSDAKVKWGFLDQPLPPNVQTSYVNGTNKYWLKIISVQLSNSGTYYCEGKDSESSFHARAVLAVSKECTQPHCGIVGTNIEKDLPLHGCKHGILFEGNSMQVCLPSSQLNGLQLEHRYIASIYSISSGVLFMSH